jgi:peptidoglycan/xylan/chitin deacetylase (PgdA/CDA1 family)
MKILISLRILGLAMIAVLPSLSCQKKISAAEAAAAYQSRGYPQGQYNPGYPADARYQDPRYAAMRQPNARFNPNPYPGPQQPAAAPRGWNSDVAGLPTGNVPNVSYSSGSRAQPYVALTFDDGPHATLTPRLLNILRDRNVKATFYVLGPNAKRNPGIMQRMVAEGHELGNHSWTHRVMSKAPTDAMVKEFQDTRDAIIAACGVAPKSQRPPYGAMTKPQRALLKEKFGYPCILWDVDPLDWKKPGSGVVASRILSDTRNGSIILLHDIHAGSVEAVPAVLDGLLAKGYTFVTVSQLLAMSGQ